VFHIRLISKAQGMKRRAVLVGEALHRHRHRPQNRCDRHEPCLL